MYRRVMGENTRATVSDLNAAVRGDCLDRSDVDGLFVLAGANDVTELARQFERRGRRRLGYEYDPPRSDSGTANSRTIDTVIHAND